jgi:hypothetical protein
MIASSVTVKALPAMGSSKPCKPISTQSIAHVRAGPFMTHVRAQRMSVSTNAGKKAPEMPPIVSPTDGTPEWYACVARADFFFNDVQNEALAEQLRELKRYYEEQNREQDFFFVCEPEWLNKFPESKQVKKPAVALVSTDKTWITFMKLRLDRVLKLDLGNMSIDEATKSTAPVPEFKDQAWIAPYSPYSKGWWEVFMRN